MRRITMLALAVVLALTGAACGDDDDTGGEDTESGSTTTAEDDGGGAATDDDVGDLVDDDCEFLLAGAFMNPVAAAQSGDEDFDTAADRLQEIADDAPDEISDAMSVLADAYVEIAEAFQDIDFSDPQAFQDPDTQAALQDLDELADEEYEAAADEVSAWMEENCTGIVGG